MRKLPIPTKTKVSMASLAPPGHLLPLVARSFFMWGMRGIVLAVHTLCSVQLGKR